MGGEPRGTQATLMMAAKAMVEVSPTAGTMVDVLSDHAFAHYAEGLRQYMIIRCGDEERGLAALSRVRDRVASERGEALNKAPGVRARIYRFAREEIGRTNLEAVRDAGSTSAAKRAVRPPTGTLAWYRPRDPSAAHQSAVARIREEAPEKELLELRFARELSPEELAFVFETSSEEITKRLESAVEAASAFHRGSKGQLSQAILEAFALEKSSRRLSQLPAAANDGEGGEQSAETDAEEETLLPLGTIVGDRYRLAKFVGAGGFADVFRAEDVEVPGHVLALKLLRKASTSERNRQQALKELRIIAAVYHPSIVQFKDYGWYEGRLWFAMPWYEGEVLEERIQREGLSRAEARAVFEPLARALGTLHAAEIRHQDVKPDNIFLAKLRGYDARDVAQVLPVLLDLGVAAKDAELVLAGTPTYFAPEVAAQFAYREGDPFPSRPIGPASDVFALALSLRNALEPETQPEVAAGAVDAFIRNRAHDEVRLFTRSDLRFLNKPLARWLAADPAVRPTADEFADELAILTRPEEQRARWVGYLKLFGPLLVAAAVVFGVVVYELRAQHRAIEEKAALAEEEAAAALANLEDAANRREELEAQVGAAQERITAQHLTSEELEQELAEAQANLTVVRRRLASARRLASERQKAVEAAERDVAEKEAQLGAERRRVSELQSSLQGREQELALVRRDLATARSGLSAAEANLRAAQRERDLATQAQASEAARATEALARSAELERQLSSARRELSAAEGRIEQLERDLAAARRASTMAGGGTMGGGTTTGGSAMESTMGGGVRRAQ